ncbi:Signal transduction histidine kinase regulating C4-dicarboxylate transport system [Streptococcus pneumoniae]|nr:Signal transduction histidine kinase regulating C4-dicarboxylate transport system [Streptococcus pneumoniae]
MGLAISKSIAELHQGDLTVRSNDKETVFTVKLPQYKKVRKS